MWESTLYVQVVIQLGPFLNVSWYICPWVWKYFRGWSPCWWSHLHNNCSCWLCFDFYTSKLLSSCPWIVDVWNFCNIVAAVICSINSRLCGAMHTSGHMLDRLSCDDACCGFVATVICSINSQLCGEMHTSGHMLDRLSCDDACYGFQIAATRSVGNLKAILFGCLSTLAFLNCSLQHQVWCLQPILNCVSVT